LTFYIFTLNSHCSSVHIILFLGKAASEILHENKGELIQGALPFIQRKAAEILLEAARKITDDLDYDKVFPEK
jgi:hypothetical protein